MMHLRPVDSPVAHGSSAAVLLLALLVSAGCTDIETVSSERSPLPQPGKADNQWRSEQEIAQDLPSDLEVPLLDEEPAIACAEATSQSYYYQFLDNLCEDKVLPSVQDRDGACPVSDDSPLMTLTTGQQALYRPSGEPIDWDTSSLQGLVPTDMHIAVILIKRIGGVPHYRYLSTGSHDTPHQPWSTSKFLAAANAAVELRWQSNQAVGLTASVDGHRLGDLVTSLVAYDKDPFTSNSLGAYFHDMGGRGNANDLIHQWWLGRPETETFGGNYGAAPPSLGSTFVEESGASVTLKPQIFGNYKNHLSVYTLAEALKRLVLHREEHAQRLPLIQWEDIKVMLYGAENSHKGQWGGMSADTAAYLHAAHDMDYIEARSQGQWNVFSKLGLGTKAQFGHVGYACWPVLDSEGDSVRGQGREFVIAAHMPQGSGSWAERDREMARVYRRIVTRIVEGGL
ncbi:MAG: hypothetical protein VYE15_04795 [Myxococcota bacterium]|nr:hypothetical protein [Myxococcota bacterium]